MSDVLFISWVRHHGRSARLAKELGANTVFVAVGRRGPKWTAPIRYGVQSLRTVTVLIVQRPSAVVCMSPPNTLVRVLLVWRRLTGGRLMVDAHSDSVLERDGSTTRESFKALAQRVDAVIVTNADLAARLSGSSCVILGDPPEKPPLVAGWRLTDGYVLFPSSWAFDEPLESLFAAATLLPDCLFVITGRPDTRRLPVDIPPNVQLPGFLTREDYERRLAGADAVLALTTRPETMQRAAYEALDRELPVIASDTKVLRDLLGDAAAYTLNDASSLVVAVREVTMERARFRQVAVEVQRNRVAAHEVGMEAIRSILSRQRGP